jgi:hypothetical protein
MTFSCTEQLAGFSELDFILLSETSNWPKVVTDQNAATITLTPEPVSVDAEIDDDSIKVSVIRKRPDVFDINISFKFKTRSESLDQLLDQYRNKPGIAIGRLNTCFEKLYGSNQEPLYLDYEVEEGETHEDLGYTLVTIKGSQRRRPAYFTRVESE